MDTEQTQIEEQAEELLKGQEQSKKEPIEAKDLNLKHITIEDIQTGCMTLAGDNEEETKLCVMQEEFKNGIETLKKCTPSVTFYGSTRISEDTEIYQKVRNLASRISKELGYAIISGGGGGLMEAANHGAFDAGGRSVGLTIRLPREQKTNPYVKEEIPFYFFFTRQVSLSYSTEVCIFCPGGFGTMNELFEMLTHLQTGKIGSIPIILYGSEFWNPLQDFIKSVLLEKNKTIAANDLNLYVITDDDDEILEVIETSRIRDGKDALN